MTLRRLASSLLLCLPWGWVVATSQAADLPAGQKAQAAADNKADKKDKPAKRKAGASAKPTLPGGSGETAAQRSARLKRECKGRPNAGACTGYTD